MSKNMKAFAEMFTTKREAIGPEETKEIGKDRKGNES